MSEEKVGIGDRVLVGNKLGTVTYVYDPEADGRSVELEELPYTVGFMDGEIDFFPRNRLKLVARAVYTNVM